MFFIDGKDSEEFSYSPEEFAEIIRNSDAFKNGSDIRLIACQAGAKPNGAAQRVADVLGVNVLAPTETVNVDLFGDVFLSDSEDLPQKWVCGESVLETGKWIKFKPRKG